MAQALPSEPSLTIVEIVQSPEWELVERVIADELWRYAKDLTALDAFDPQLTQKTTALTAKIKALRSLNRRFYEIAGLKGAAGEEALTERRLAV